MRNRIRLILAAASALVIGLALGAAIAWGQYTASNYSEPGGAAWVVGGTLTVVSGGTFNGTAGTVMIPVADTSAATCTVGEMYLDTDETDDTGCTTTADNSLCVCVATNTWASVESS